MICDEWGCETNFCCQFDTLEKKKHHLKKHLQLNDLQANLCECSWLVFDVGGPKSTVCIATLVQVLEGIRKWLNVSLKKTGTEQPSTAFATRSLFWVLALISLSHILRAQEF